jgi:F-type H+-transporting ATPase subunit a
MGEDTAIAILVGLGVSLYFIPIQFPILVLGLLTTLIQAVVFSILSSVYIGGAIGHQDEH